MGSDFGFGFLSLVWLILFDTKQTEFTWFSVRYLRSFYDEFGLIQVSFSLVQVYSFFFVTKVHVYFQ